MILNNRLEKIADHITKGQAMADIGTDHGFLPLYLWEKEICSRLIMADISEASLNKAIHAFEKYKDRDGVSFRVGDGLSVIGESEVDVIVIAGMGGALITEILGKDMTKTISFPYYIFQPRNGAEKLRYWLEKARFLITSECLAEEGKFICEIIMAKPPKIIQNVHLFLPYTDDIRYEIPKTMDEKSKYLFAIYINNKINTEKKILKEMICGFAADEKIGRTRERIKFLEGVLNDAQK